MRRGDDVFFLTLVDFLVQALFFGLLMLAAWLSQQDTRQKKVDEEKQISESMRDIQSTMGVSNMSELTDYLSKLAPVSHLRGVAEFFQRGGSLESAQRLQRLADEHGGADSIEQKLEKLNRIEQGYGKPPCLYSIQGSRRIPTILATVTATDTRIRFRELTPDLQRVLQELGREYRNVEELPLQEFDSVFYPIRRKHPDCFFSLRFVERTRFVDARDKAQRSFYLSIEK